jgi:hypothetical protein
VTLTCIYLYIKQNFINVKGTKLLGRPRRRWEDNIKIDLREIDIDEGTGFGWLRIGYGGGFL